MKTYLLGCGSKVVEPKYKPGTIINSSEMRINQLGTSWIFNYDNEFSSKTISLTVRVPATILYPYNSPQYILVPFTLSSFSGSAKLYRNLESGNSLNKSNDRIRIDIELYKSGNGIYARNRTYCYWWRSGDDTGADEGYSEVFIRDIKVI